MGGSTPLPLLLQFSHNGYRFVDRVVAIRPEPSTLTSTKTFPFTDDCFTGPTPDAVPVSVLFETLAQCVLGLPCSPRMPKSREALYCPISGAFFVRSGPEGEIRRLADVTEEFLSDIERVPLVEVGDGLIRGRSGWVLMQQGGMDLVG